jgi:hypothetical protein
VAAQAPRVKLGALVGVSLSMLPLVFSEQGPRLTVKAAWQDAAPATLAPALETA